MASSRLTEDGRCVITTPGSGYSVGQAFYVIGSAAEFAAEPADWAIRLPATAAGQEIIQISSSCSKRGGVPTRARCRVEEYGLETVTETSSELEATIAYTGSERTE